MDSDSGYNAGILVAAHKLRDEGNLTVEEHRQLRLCLKWFNDELEIPTILKEPEHRRAISWFKSEAKEPIAKMWELKKVLIEHGIHVEVLHTIDPGVVVYEDKWQVIAKPQKRLRSQ
ncbi:hypothetical protein CJD38_05855 [Stenotrophobium rhamnosiphilum]|uniref:Uncharacterized protein n=1 Tax=Stenotrophobium rhamnosiphilum TaxID=2029166 RepID=A0A2T5MHZ4_9GAMM|nr:hypothetical protein CJD38_05855 [Stenotrophobium rhamnosiphilum]